MLDICSRKVVGSAMDNHIGQGLVTLGLQMAAAHRQRAAGALLHSDSCANCSQKSELALLRFAVIMKYCYISSRKVPVLLICTGPYFVLRNRAEMRAMHERCCPGLAASILKRLIT